MKLIIAHLPNGAFESVRTDLFDLGVLRTTISEVHSSAPGSAKTLRYRGAAVRSHLRSELRLAMQGRSRELAAIPLPADDLLRQHRGSVRDRVGRFSPAKG